jgi:hypothetical protein
VRHFASKEIFARRRKDIDDLSILWKDTFVLGVAGYHATSPETIDFLSFPMRKSILPLSIQTICS